MGLGSETYNSDWFQVRWNEGNHPELIDDATELARNDGQIWTNLPLSAQRHYLDEAISDEYKRRKV